MASTTKFLGTEIALSTANNVGLAKLVRLHNTTAATVLITQKSGSTTVATFTMSIGEIVNIMKPAADTLTAASAIKAVSIAYTN